MRTLFLLAALLLVAFQARAQTLQETADQVPAQDQAGAKDQDQAGAKDQDMAITFTGEDHLVRQASGPRRGAYCYCTLYKHCDFPDKKSGTCRLHGRRGKLCCR